MRLITVRGPQGSAEEIAHIATSVGIAEVSVYQKRRLRTGQTETVNDVIDIETATPTAKKFIDTLIAAPFFDQETYVISVRQPRSIISSQPLSKITRPLAEPTIDILEELWQFSHVTLGFVGRILIGAFLLAYGIIQFKLLFMIAGLLFIPLLPPILAVGFGVWTRQFRLAAQGMLAFIVATFLLICGGVVVALMTSPPLLYTESNSLLTGLLISLVVGVAAGLATADDVGRREMIGLAATAQVAILPVWFGICFVFGFPILETNSPSRRALGFGVNVISIVVAAFTTYAALRMKRLHRLKQN
jgi:hypothetical protein